MGNKKAEPTINQTATVATPTKKILIVEDEKLLADALEVKLKGAGYETFKAENGQLGLSSISQNKPDLVILDIMMPIMDGRQMLTKLREMSEFKNLPVLMLTNAGTSDNMHETKFYFNAVDFLIKSNVSLEEIVAKVKQLV
ncbi:MAG TPA: response regulator [Patescibacteria group bacterium]|nr:response regulator [Patescibacteria group bacterium]